MAKRKGNESALRRQVEILKAQIKSSGSYVQPVVVDNSSANSTTEKAKSNEPTLNIPYIKRELQKTLLFFVAAVVILVVVSNSQESLLGMLKLK